MLPETTKKQKQILRSLSNGSIEVKSPISTDEKYLRDCGLIFYRGRKSAKEPNLGWYLTDKGREYLQQIRADRSAKAVEWIKWIIGVSLTLFGILIALYFGKLDHPKVPEHDQQDQSVITNILDEDIDPGSMCVSDEPSSELPK